MLISVPSKTFIVGEYIALDGGPALVMNTEPRFQLRAMKSSEFSDEASEFSESTFSAMKIPQIQNLLQKPFFQDYKFEFLDPYGEKGGFGASGALAAMLFGFEKVQQNKEIIPLEITNCVRNLWGKDSGSGYDVVSQMTGSISYIHAKEERALALAWPFKNLEMKLLRGKKKTKTHEAIKAWRDQDSSALVSISKKALEALTSADENAFVGAVNAYYAEMVRLDLCDLETKSLVDQLKQESFVRAAKGCGARASDVILLILDKNRPHTFDLMIDDIFESYSGKLSAGFKVENERATGRDVLMRENPI